MEIAWLDKLTEDVEERVSQVARFKTKKLRNQFLGDLTNLIKMEVIKNVATSTPPEATVQAAPDQSGRWATQGVTKIVPGKERKGHVVRTAADSAQADEQAGRGVF